MIRETATRDADGWKAISKGCAPTSISKAASAIASAQPGFHTPQNVHEVTIGEKGRKTYISKLAVFHQSNRALKQGNTLN